MNIFAKAGLICLMSVSLVTIANAGHDDKMMMAEKGKWVCETNASSASTDADKKADEEMKKAGGGKMAFDFAMKHCRDCTKITCTMEK